MIVHVLMEKEILAFFLFDFYSHFFAIYTSQIHIIINLSPTLLYMTYLFICIVCFLSYNLAALKINVL